MTRRRRRTILSNIMYFKGNACGARMTLAWILEGWNPLSQNISQNSPAASRPEAEHRRFLEKSPTVLTQFFQKLRACFWSRHMRRCARCAHVTQFCCDAGARELQPIANPSSGAYYLLWCSLIEPSPCVPRQAPWQQFPPPRTNCRGFSLDGKGVRSAPLPARSSRNQLAAGPQPATCFRFISCLELPKTRGPV